MDEPPSRCDTKQLLESLMLRKLERMRQLPGDSSDSHDKSLDDSLCERAVVACADSADAWGSNPSGVVTGLSPVAVAAAAEMTSEGLIMPRKLPNPCLESSDHKQLRREIVFNHKVGKSVLCQKTELQRAMERREDLRKQREMNCQTRQKRSSFEIALEQRLQSVEPLQQPAPVSAASGDSSAMVPEFMRVHARLCHKPQDAGAP